MSKRHRNRHRGRATRPRQNQINQTKIQQRTVTRPNGAKPGGRFRHSLRRQVRYVALSVALIILASAYGLLHFEAQPSPLPATEDLVASPSLSNLPVTISNITSCACWSGVRHQSEFKLKFQIVNNTNGQSVDIGGGLNSNIRLIVAYKKSFRPVLTLPKSEPGDKEIDVTVPSGVLTDRATHYETYYPQPVFDPQNVLLLPNGFRAWAEPPTPDNLVELYAGTASVGTYATEVGSDTLDPGYQYYDSSIGWGDWVFYTDLPSQLRADYPSGYSPFVPVVPQSETDRYEMLIGVAVFDSLGDMDGFAPMPSWSNAANPNDF